MTTTHRSVTGKQPCPVCGGDHKCRIGADGSIQCGRVPEGLRPGQQHNGHVLMGLSQKDPQFGTFRAVDDPVLSAREADRREHPQLARESRNGTAHARDMAATARRLANNFTEAHRAELARELGLPECALAMMPLIGYSQTGFHKDNEDRPCYTFPEMSAGGAVTGITCRYPDGAKKAMPGGNRGLFVANGWQDREGPVFLPEGASDTLTATALGLAAVGRPSNAGGVDQLADLLQVVPPDRPIVVVAEWDPKPDGKWPGMEGGTANCCAII